MFYVLWFLLVVCLYGVVYGRLMDAKTWPLFGLYKLRFIHYQKVFIPALIKRRKIFHFVGGTVNRGYEKITEWPTNTALFMRDINYETTTYNNQAERILEKRREHD